MDPTTPPRRRTLRAWLLLTSAAAVLLPGLVALAAAWVWAGAADPRLRAALLLLLTVQAMAVAAGLMWQLGRGVEGPLNLLAAQVQRLAAQRPAAAIDWPHADEFAPLARELDTLRQRIADRQGELRAAELRLQRAEALDTLTGLPNRALLRELFTRESASARRDGRSLALLTLGLDRLRTYNDTLGHAAGDEVLIGMGQRIAATLRDADAVCRAGGDEFHVLLPGAAGWDGVARAAERLLRAIERPMQLPTSGHELTLSAGIGVAMYPTDGGGFEDLERAAGVALARSKSLGRGLYSFYQPELDAALRRRIGAERELALALEREEFSLFYQPIVDARSGRWIACEALLRWQHPRRGLLQPAAFIDAARQCGLIRDIDAWALDRACRDLARWRDDGLPLEQVAVNLSVQQARNPALADIVQAALERHALRPEQLELEVTEDLLVGEPDGAPRVLARWRELGLALTVDDFGVGYTSLAQLKALRPDRLKIDCALVPGLPGSADDRALTQAMLGMAQALRIEVVAECVETPEQSDWLLAQGCVRQQGHGYAEAMGRHEFEQRLRMQLAGATPSATVTEPA